MIIRLLICSLALTSTLQIAYAQDTSTTATTAPQEAEEHIDLTTIQIDWRDLSKEDRQKILTEWRNIDRSARPPFANYRREAIQQMTDDKKQELAKSAKKRYLQEQKLLEEAKENDTQNAKTSIDATTQPVATDSDNIQFNSVSETVIELNNNTPDTPQDSAEEKIDTTPQEDDLSNKVKGLINNFIGN